jgi:hypothetical protein
LSEKPWDMRTETRSVASSLQKGAAIIAPRRARAGARQCTSPAAGMRRPYATFRPDTGDLQVRGPVLQPTDPFAVHAAGNSDRQVSRYTYGYFRLMPTISPFDSTGVTIHVGQT